MRIRPTALAGLVLASFAFVAPAGLAQGFEKVLPADTLVFVGFDDVTKMKEAAIASPQGKLWQDPACAGLRDAVSQILDIAKKKGLENAGLDPVALLEAIKGPAAFAMLQLTEPKSTGPASLSMGGAFAALLDVGQDGESVMAQIEAALEKKKDEAGMQRSAETAGDVEVTLLEFGDPADEERMQVRFGLAGSVFVVVAGSASVAEKDHMGTIVANLKAGSSDDALVDADAFSKSLAGTEGSGMRLYFDTHTLVSRMRAFAAVKGSSPEEQKVMEGLGLDDFGTASAFGELLVAGAASETRVDWSGQGAIVAGLQALLPKGEPELYSLVPDTAMSAIDVHLDLAAGYDHVIATMKDLGMITEEELSANLQMAEQELGFAIRDDLLANFGTELTYFVAPVEDETQALAGSEDNPQNLAVILRLKDGKKLEALVEGIITKSGMGAARKRTDFQGFNINTMPIPGGMFGSANYVFTDELLVFSLSSELVQGVVRRTASGTDLPNLRNKSEVAALLESGPKEASVFALSDSAAAMKDVVSSVRNAVTQMVRSGKPKAQMDPDEAKLLELIRGLEFPDDEVIEKYVSGFSLMSVSISDDGARVLSTQ